MIDVMSPSTIHQPLAPRASMRWLPPLLVLYALLALLGSVLHRPALSLGAAALLLLALAIPVLRRPSVAGALLWLLVAALLLIPAALRRVQLALAGLPIVILGASFPISANPQLMLRAGIAPPTAPTPRRPLAEVISVADDAAPLG